MHTVRGSTRPIIIHQAEQPKTTEDTKTEDNITSVTPPSGGDKTTAAAGISDKFGFWIVALFLVIF